MKQPIIALALALLVLGLAIPGYGQESSLGTVVGEKPDSVGEYLVRLQEGHALQRGDVVALRRAGQQSALGEAFVVQVQANQAVVSLKGDYSVRPGDSVAFLRRPALVAAPPSPPPTEEEPPAANSSATVQDPNGRFSLRLPEGWSRLPQTQRPDLLALAGPSGQFLFLATLPGQVPAEMLRDPEVRARFSEMLGDDLKQRNIQMAPPKDITMFNRQGLRMELTGAGGIPGYAVFLPGNDHVFLGMGVAATAEGLKSTEVVLRTVRMR